eukprot:CFRG0989T1
MVPIVAEVPVKAGLVKDCPCSQSVQVPRIESKIRFTLKKTFSADVLPSLNEYSNSQQQIYTVPRSKRQKPRKSTGTFDKVFLPGSRKFSDTSYSSCGTESPPLFSDNNVSIRHRFSQSSTDTMTDGGISSASTSRSPSRKSSTDIDQLNMAYRERLAHTEEAVVSRVNALGERIDRTVIDLLSLISKDCSHNTCNMVQINMASRLLDRTCRAEMKCRSTVQAYLQKQCTKIRRLAHIDAMEMNLSNYEMRQLFYLIQEESQRAVALANEVLLSIHDKLYGWHQKICKITKGLLKPCKDTDGVLNGLGRKSNDCRNGIVTMHEAQKNMPPVYEMKYPPDSVYSIINIVTSECFMRMMEGSEMPSPAHLET